jgi:hypothetical protein
MDVRPRPDGRNDAELVRAATAGDRGAFAAIYDRYADRLHDLCRSVLRDRDEAADATHRALDLDQHLDIGDDHLYGPGGAGIAGRHAGQGRPRGGPVSAAGTVSWQVVAADARGNSASASGPPVRVLARP